MRSYSPTTVGILVSAAAGIIVTVSCADRAEPTRATVDAAHTHVATNQIGTYEPALGRKLAALRHATARYHDFEAAVADGYGAQITPCMEIARGGMGYHYGKIADFDGVVIEAKPEVLLYEPRAGGRLSFVGVEFLIPFTAWSGAQPPVLYGQTFARNETFQVWALHVWVGRANPRGIFADWNPTVTCARDNA